MVALLMSIEEGFCGAEFKLWIKDAYFVKDDGLRQLSYNSCLSVLKVLHRIKIGRFSKEIEKQQHWRMFQTNNIHWNIFQRCKMRTTTA